MPVKIWLIVFGFVVQCLFAQVDSTQFRLEKQWQEAERLFANEQYFDAVTEYQRLLFFDHDHNFAYRAYSRIADCYKNGAQFDQAIKYQYKTLEYAGTKEARFDAALILAKLNILAHRSVIALNVLEGIEKDTLYFSRKTELHYWRGWAYMFDNEWGKAADVFSKIDSAKVLSHFCRDVSSKQISPEWIKIWSVIIPGSGQMITGQVFNGLISFSWNVLWGYLTVRAVQADRIGDAVLIGDLLWLRFYTGNLQTAEKLANEKNIAIYHDALRYLQNEFQGTKP